jgi:hypothetical protein
MLAELDAAEQHYRVTFVLLDQGASDFALHTPEAQYRAALASLIDSLRAAGVQAPVFITRCSRGSDDWTADNPIARSQAALADARQGVFDGPDTDRDVTLLDRYDGYHFSASGQEKYAEAWVVLLGAHRAGTLVAP